MALAALLLAAAGATRAQAAANSAHELTFWTGFDQVMKLSDAQLDGFADMGVGGFVMQTKFLTDGWTDNPRRQCERRRYAMQRQIRDSRIVQRAAARGSTSTSGFSPPRCQLLDPVLRLVRRRGLGAHGREDGRPRWCRALLGFRGIAIDQELYGGKARWTWNYPGNTHTRPRSAPRPRSGGARR